MRLAWNDQVLVKRVLDAGAQTIMVPFVQTAEEARQAVSFAKYPPEGVRGVAAVHRGSRFGRVADYLKRANDQVAVIVQLETPEAIERLPDIAAVPGIDALFVGPGDLAAAMGHIGNIAHPEVQTLIERAAKMAHDAGKPVGIVGPNPDMVRRFIGYGYSYRGDCVRYRHDDEPRLRVARCLARSAGTDGCPYGGLLRFGEMPLTVALDVRAELGECPIWDADAQTLFFVDIKGKALHRFLPATGEHAVMTMPEEIGCIGLRKGGGFVAGFRSGLWLLDPQGGRESKLADNPEDLRTSRFNDGRVDPAGRFLAGTIDEPKDGGRAHLYRYDRRGLVELAGGLLTSNGVAFSPDGRTLYHSDTPTFTVWRYAYDPATGQAKDKTLFLRLQPSEADRGRPDGAAVDAEGCYWTALFEGGRIQRYAPDGRLLAEYPVPARCPTMICFAGADLKTLYVTSARTGRTKDELEAFPHSGSLFSMPVDVPGLPETRFDPSV